MKLWAMKVMRCLFMLVVLVNLWVWLMHDTMVKHLRHSPELTDK